MTLIYKTFAKQAGEDKQLNKAELRGLIEEEFPSLQDAALHAGDEDTGEKLLKDLDWDESESIDFMEYVSYLAATTCCIHKH
ncbi:Oidioi.mRNA.OKI2018_I69.chr1.g1790.t1.cds [Oikopleura dioica]|uniref:Oidioi.mRNA.OKI2018_I69.chr1.g1790.t1.cds n=1 Tax=Oikopleura dioica TaxID=34765 RepID=A0ABN7SP15_OIKDI|nr:Oidioi.mRNA.OKI2018_I69.chr1.g1790.t1.cds [Oikopleura dioica]